jgi:hypothetical protein
MDMTCVPQHTLIGGPENLKLLFDECLDARRETLANQRAWEAHKLRVANNSATFDHFVNMFAATASASASQTGQTENQASVSPIRTGAADTQVQQPAGAVYPAIRNSDNLATTATGAVETAIAGVATANQSIADSIANLVAALVSSIVAAQGKASSTAGS